MHMRARVRPAMIWLNAFSTLQGALGLLVYALYPQIPLLEVVLATGAPRDWKSRVRTLPGSVSVEASAIKHLRARLHNHWHCLTSKCLQFNTIHGIYAKALRLTTAILQKQLLAAACT